MVDRLADLYPGSTQTRLLRFSRSGDSELWFYARTHGFVLVTKDSDIAELAVLRGAPPKVIWLRMGNCSARSVEDALRANVTRIEEFAATEERIVLELFE